MTIERTEMVRLSANKLFVAQQRARECVTTAEDAVAWELAGDALGGDWGVELQHSAAGRYDSDHIGAVCRRAIASKCAVSH